MLNQLLVGFVAFLGFFGGIWLQRQAPGEVKEGIRYLLVAEKLFLIAVFVPALVNKIWFVALLLIGAFAVSGRSSYRTEATYGFFIILLVATASSTFFTLEASLIFLYGLIAGSILKPFQLGMPFRMSKLNK